MRTLSRIEVLSFTSGRKELIDLCVECGCWQGDDHFPLAGGKHSSFYFDKDRLLSEDKVRQLACELVYQQLKLIPTFREVTALIGPERWGTVLCHLVEELAAADGHKLKVVEVQKTASGRYDISAEQSLRISGELFCFLDDVYSDGSTYGATEILCRRNGGQMILIATLLRRLFGSLRQNDGRPEIISLMDSSFPAWDISECSLCENNIPLSDVLGHHANKNRSILGRQPTFSS